MALATGIAFAAPPHDDPAAELASFKLADGFEVNLFADESLGVANPVQIRWDAKGRLWVICTWAYPQIEPGEVPNDKVFVLEDTDGDGRADKSTVFADGLNMPMGLAHGDGGIYVGAGVDLLHLKDTNGDDVADERRVVLTGFGTGDTHQNINNFTWSHGGAMVFCQGLHAYSRVETPWGVERLDAAGVWRLRPRRLKMDGFFGRELAPHNPWGIVFDNWGQPIVLAGNGHGVYWLTPAAIRSDLLRELPPLFRREKYAGGDMLSGRHLPAAVHGQIVTGGFMNGTVVRFDWREDGGHYRLTELPPLMTSTHDSFRPVDVKVGPDGAIYVCDWYNRLIGHYQTSYRDPGRDKTHGRIWRITAKGRPLATRPNLTAMNETQLLDQLRGDERWVREQAKRVLADRPTAKVTAALSEWVAKLDVNEANDPRYERLLFEAIGVYETHEVVEPVLLGRLLEAKDARVRAYATGVIAHWHDRLADPLALLARQINDADRRVRIEAVVALSYLPSANAAEVAARALDHPMDEQLDYTLTHAIHAMRDRWRPALDDGRLTFDDNAKHLAYVLNVAGAGDSLGYVRGLAWSKQLPAETRARLMTLLVNVGEPADMAAALRREPFIADNAYQPAMHAQLLDELADVYALRRVKPEGDLAGELTDLLHADDAAVRAATVRLIGAWGVQSLGDEVVRLASDDAANPMVRRSAVVTWATLRPAEARPALEAMAAHDASTPMHVKLAAVDAIAATDVPGAAKLAAQLLRRADAGFDPSPLVGVFLARADGSDALAAAIADPPLRADVARRCLRAMNRIGRGDAALTAALNRAIGQSSPVPPYNEQYVLELAAEVSGRGDAARGEVVFRDAATNCMACHAIAGAGGRLGPDVANLGAAMPVEQIIEAVVWPDRQVKEGFLSIVVGTKDGKVHQGYKVKQEAGVMTLRDTTTNRVVRVAVDDIAFRHDAGTLMPPGLTAALTRDELRDLVRFLSELGRGDAPLRYRIAVDGTIRTWAVYEGAAAALPPSPNDPAWRPRYSMVSGELPADQFVTGDTATSIVMHQVRVIRGGRFTMALNDAAGVRLWLDGQPMQAATRIEAALEPGLHTIVMAIDSAARAPGVPLQCRWTAVRGGEGELNTVIEPTESR